MYVPTEGVHEHRKRSAYKRGLLHQNYAKPLRSMQQSFDLRCTGLQPRMVVCCTSQWVQAQVICGFADFSHLMNRAFVFHASQVPLSICLRTSPRCHTRPLHALFHHPFLHRFSCGEGRYTWWGCSKVLSCRILHLHSINAYVRIT